MEADARKRLSVAAGWSATRVTATTVAVLTAASTMVHGYRELVLGNTPTSWGLLASIGAFTVIPNYFATGIAAILMSIAVVVWTVGFVDRPRGPLVLFCLFVLLFLVGGGVAQVVACTLVWLMSTRIDGSLSWWRRVLPAGWTCRLGMLWPWLLAAALCLAGAAVEIWLLGWLPGVTDATLKLHITWSLLVAGLAVLLVDVVASFARDIERRAERDG